MTKTDDACRTSNEDTERQEGCAEVNASTSHNAKHSNPASKSVVLFSLVLSTLAAAFGVQSRKNLEQDFQQKSALPFIMAGVIFTVLFVLVLYLIVKIILSTVN